MNNWQAFATKAATTARLTLSYRDRLRLWWLQHERHVRDGLWGAVLVVFVLLIHSLLRPVEQPMTPIVQQPGAAMLIATPTAGPAVPTATPWPTPAPVVEVQVQTTYVEVHSQSMCRWPRPSSTPRRRCRRLIRPSRPRRRTASRRR